MGALALTLLLAFSGQAGVDFDTLVDDIEEGRFALALRESERISDPLVRAQGRLYVLHHAGDLAGALAAGRAGLALAPGDLWLLERSAAIATSLGIAEAAVELASRLSEAVEQAPLGGEELAEWRVVAAETSSAAAALALQGRRKEASMIRARSVVLAGALAAGLAFSFLSRRVQSV